MEQQGSSRVEKTGINDEHNKTLAGSMSGELLPNQLLYQGKQIAAIQNSCSVWCMAHTKLMG